MSSLDTILICGDIPREMIGYTQRKEMLLHINEMPATIDFLKYYFKHKRNLKTAMDVMQKDYSIKFLSCNGPYLYQYLKKKGISVFMIHQFTSDKSVLLEILKNKPKAVVISTTFLSSTDQIEEIASFIKGNAPEVLVIAGGIKIWKSYKMSILMKKGFIPDDINKEVVKNNYFLSKHGSSSVDIFIINDKGEYTLFNLLKLIKSGKEYKNLNNIAYLKMGEWVINNLVPEPGEFGEEYIDWSFLSPELIGLEIPIQAGTGCQYKCTFCDFHGLRKMYLRSIKSIIKEIETITPVNGVRKIFFTNDNFLCSVKRTRDICRELIKSKLLLQWRAFIRIDSITEETAELLYKSGCRECLLGVESGDPNLLLRMNKNISPDKILSRINILNQVGINTQSTLIVGFPGENEKTMQNTIDMLNAYSTKGPGIHFYYLFPFTLFPLSIVSFPQYREKYKIKGYLNNWSHFTMSSEEALQNMVKISDSLKVELSPIYFERREMPNLNISEQKEVFFLRNKILKIQKRLIVDNFEPKLWDRLEWLLSKK